MLHGQVFIMGHVNMCFSGDNLNSPRTKSLGGDGSADLPSPRLISRRIHNEGGNRAFSTDLSLHVSNTVTF